jgi:hypothetical protein
MEKVFIALVCIVCFASCNGKSTKAANDSTATQTVDTTKSNMVKDSINKRKAIDAQMAEGDRPDSEQETPSPAEERKRLLKKYDEVKIIDTILVSGKDSLHLHLKYYCVKDSNLVIPKKYVFDDKNPQDFITHGFASNILLVHHRDTIFNKTIRRSDFNSVITDQLRNYGTLKMPYLSEFNKDKNQVILHYSISIPATEIGTGASLIINKKGDFRVAKD